MTDFFQSTVSSKKNSARCVFFGAFVKKLCKSATQAIFAALGGPLLGAAATAGVLEEAPAVPSGYTISLLEILFETRDDASRVARFRYVMPLMRQGIAFAEIEGDFFHLCNGVAVPYLAVSREKVDQVIISMADRETEFGETTQLAQQYFEAFSVHEGSCIWEGF
jgi:hypothetical protein